MSFPNRLILYLLPALLCLSAKGAVDRYLAGDNAFRKRAAEGEARSALRLYRRLRKEDPRDGDAAWRLAMACEFVGFRLTSTEQEKKDLFREGRDAGLASVALLPRCAPCEFWTAINQALYGQTVGAFKMLFSLGEVKEHLKSAIALDPGYAFGGAYRVLGLIEQNLPGILGGSNSRARESFEKAISSSPEEPMNYLFLARLLHEELDEPSIALAVARKGMRLPLPPPERLESREASAELKTLAEKWSGELGRR